MFYLLYPKLGEVKTVVNISSCLAFHWLSYVSIGKVLSQKCQRQQHMTVTTVLGLANLGG
jgi:hypothetical protein